MAHRHLPIATPILASALILCLAGTALTLPSAPSAQAGEARAAPAGSLAAGGIATPEGSEAAPGGNGVVRVLAPGDTVALQRRLTAAGISEEEAAGAIAAITAGEGSEAAMQPGREILLHPDPSRPGGLLALTLEPAPGRLLHVRRSGLGWTVREERLGDHRHLVLARGEVRGDSLVASLEVAGLPGRLAQDLLRALAQTLDLQREVQPGARFTILFERFRDAEGSVLRHGGIVHAAFDLHERRLSVWHHRSEDGQADWYDDEGRSLHRTFLRTPLDEVKLTSGFGMRRHPMLGFTRAHQGVDFAAPRGTPVYAAAEGVVSEAGRMSGYGLTIRLAHAGGAETVYAHLSAITRGLRPGDAVAQGALIGRVGATGLATGNHLHYEVHVNGRAVNPATVAELPAPRLEGPALAAFLAARQSMQTQLARLAPMQEVASAD